MKLESVFAGLNISAMGLSAQRKRMNAIASNLANAETTRTEQGGPYKRKIVEITAKGAKVFSSVMRQAGIRLSTTHAGHMDGGGIEFKRAQDMPGQVESNEVDDDAPPKMVYDPGNPDANPDGYVAMPNVNVVTEMVNMIAASRSFEANVAAINAAKTMAKDALEI